MAGRAGLGGAGLGRRPAPRPASLCSAVLCCSQTRHCCEDAVGATPLRQPPRPPRPCAPRPLGWAGLGWVWAAPRTQLEPPSTSGDKWRHLHPPDVI